jgi:hypothetical protein
VELGNFQTLVHSTASDTILFFKKTVKGLMDRNGGKEEFGKSSLKAVVTEVGKTPRLS